MRKQIDANLRIKIQARIKNRLDISDLIEGYDISGENLSRAIITKLNVCDMNISNTDFSDSIIGSKDNNIMMNRTRFKHCSFLRAQIIGIAYMRHALFLNCNFKETFMPYIDYKFSQWQNCVFCDAVFAIGTGKGLGAIFDNKFFGDLSENWGVVVLRKTEYEKLLRGKENG